MLSVIWRVFEINHPQINLGLKMLRISWPCTIYHTSSSSWTVHHIFPSTNSSQHQTNFGTCPHSSQAPRSLRRNSVLFLVTSSCFTFLVPIRFALLPVLRSASLHFISCMFSSLDFTAAPQSLRSTGSSLRFPFLYRTIPYLFFSLVQRCGSLPWTLLRAPILSPLCTI